MCFSEYTEMVETVQVNYKITLNNVTCYFLIVVYKVLYLFLQLHCLFVGLFVSQDAFNKAIQRYIIPDESDEEISIEYNTGNDRKRPRVSSPVKIAEKVTEVSINHKITAENKLLVQF